MTVVEAAYVQRRTRGGGGGVAGRRAVTRWAWRMFRREWRQQIVVLVLLSVTVAAAVFAAIAAYNLPPSESAEFGSAERRITLSSPDPAALQSELAKLADQYAPVETIWHAQLPIPGSVETLDLRAEDPQGLYGRPLLSLLDGHYPTKAGEVAVTNGVAAMFGVGVGDQLAVLTEPWTVVGLVENPTQLDDEFILTLPGDPRASEKANLLFSGHPDEHQAPAHSIRGFPTPVGINGITQSRAASDRGPAVIAALSLDTIALLLVSLVAAAGFVVVAQRRLRQFGMLAAMGATSRQLRLVTIAHGLVAGLVSAVVGSGVALVGWFTWSSSLESVANHRINSSDVPWWVLAAGIGLALLTTTAAAWWPARTTARVPVVTALSGRPPRPKRAHRSALAAVLFFVVGFACLAKGIDKQGVAKPFPFIAGPIAIVLGILFLCPIAIRALAMVAGRLPIAVRLALRDLARYQARAAAALAAISLGLGIAFTAIVVSAAATPAHDSGNLSDRQMLLRLGDFDLVPERTSAQIDQLDVAVNQLAASFGAVVYPLDAATSVSATGEPFVDPEGRTGHPVILVGQRVDHGISIEGNSGTVYVANANILARDGVDPSTIQPSAEVLTPASGDLILVDPSGFNQKTRLDEETSAVVQAIADPGYSDQPKAFITETAMSSHGWVAVRAGWLIESGHPITSQQRAAAHDLAAQSGIALVTRNQNHDLFLTRLIATAVGMLLALSILAMTIGLIRGEAGRDMQTLTATGASSSARRMITAATAGALALLGALLGLMGAYVALIAGYSDDLSRLTRVPIANLLVVVLGLPVVAATVAWLVGGREPAAIARQALD
jgi:putative ABC transport system permease protein